VPQLIASGGSTHLISSNLISSQLIASGGSTPTAPVRELSAATRGAGCTHVFGHTHFSMDKTIDGVRYVQQPLGNPGERGNGWQIHCDEAAPYARVWPMRSRSFMEGRLPLHGSGSPAALPGGFARRQN
jgi:hypothetical protein